MLRAVLVVVSISLVAIMLGFAAPASNAPAAAQISELQSVEQGVLLTLGNKLLVAPGEVHSV